jgi:hypothetical protein
MYLYLIEQTLIFSYHSGKMAGFDSKSLVCYTIFSFNKTELKMATMNTLSPEMLKIFKAIRKAIGLLELEGLQYEADYLEETFDHIKQSIDFE